MLEWLLSKLPGPNRGPRAVSLVTVIAQHLDAAVARAKVAAKVDLPSEAPDDALPSLARDRNTPRMPGEPLDVWRVRMAAAFETASWVGTRRGILAPLVLARLGGPSVYTQRQLPRPPNPAWWARMTIVFLGRVVWDGGDAWEAFAWDSRAVAPIEAMDPDTARGWIRGLERSQIGARDRITSAIIARGALLWDAGDAWESLFAVWDAATVTDLSSPAWDSPRALWDIDNATTRSAATADASPEWGWCWDYLL